MNPELTAEAVAELLEGTLTGELGIEVLELSDELARGRLVVERRHLHPFGFAHGGSWVTLADSVAAWGTLRHWPPGTPFGTVEMKLNVFVGAEEGDELIATATPLHVGRRTQVWEVRVHNRERLAANFTCTQMALG